MGKYKHILYLSISFMGSTSGQYIGVLFSWEIYFNETTLVWILKYLYFSQSLTYRLKIFDYSLEKDYSYQGRKYTPYLL